LTKAEWGGNWKKFLDMPHVELPGLTVRQCRAYYDEGGLEAVWTRAAARLSEAA
jgi:hypothetical protein